MADQSKDLVESKWEGGEVLFAGGTDWYQMGRSTKRKMTDKERKEYEQRAERYPNLLEPHRIKSLMGVRIQFISAGCAACHCIAGDVDGRCFTWGRNEKGQLGLGDLVQRNMPVIVEGLKDERVIGACGGRHHTAVVASNGKSYTFGSNLHGQCGTKVIKSREKSEELIMEPVEASITNCTMVSCGCEFTMWLCAGKLYGAGLPQYGQLGDGTDHEYNAKEEREIIAVACGHNHTIAVDSDGIAFSWGFGGYGRLGHKVQQDEHKPRPIESFLGRVRVEKEGLVVAAGGTSSFLTTTGGELYSWGKLKTNGDSNMYPMPFSSLSGWKIRSMSCGPTTFSVAADTSVITWGHATNGELGYGPYGRKSSANPDKAIPCEALEGMHAHQVASGVGYNMFLVRPDEKRLKDMPVWDCEYKENVATPKKGSVKKVMNTAVGSKRKSDAPGRSKKKKK